MSTLTIDVRMIYASGIGTYLRNLVPRLVRDGGMDCYHLLGPASRLREERWAAADRVRIRDVRAPIYSIGEQVELGRKASRLGDLYWAPHYNVPLVRRRPMVVTVHDLIHLALPEYTTGIHRRAYARLMFEAVRRRASTVICDSHFTADELMRLVGVDARKIRVIHLGVDEVFFSPPRAAAVHPRPYLLYVGNVKPHKNVLGLIRAFARLVDQVPHDLVVVGQKEGFLTGDERVERAARALGSRVSFTGRITDEEVRGYLAAADALVLPSFYEGFGLPPLEAMASGCPVVVSRAASLPEVCGDAAVYCDPHDDDDIAAAIRRVLASRELRAELSEKGLAHARGFTWDRCAAETMEVLRSAAT